MSCLFEYSEIMEEETYFRIIRLSYFPPFNADFDGDDINIYTPQNCDQQREIQDLSVIKEGIVGTVWIGNVRSASFGERCLPIFE